MKRLLITLVLFSCKREKNKEESSRNEIPQEIKLNVELQISSRGDTTLGDIKWVLNL